MLLSAALGAFTLLRARPSFWQVALGVYSICLSMNYVPMLVYPIVITRDQTARAEIGDELNNSRRAMGKYRRQSLFLLLPLGVPIIALRQTGSSCQIASLTNSCVLVGILLSFPLVLHWTGALAVANVSPHSQQHTRAFLKFCLVPTAFLWLCFTIALAGIRRGKITLRELLGANWDRWQAVLRDLGIASATFFAMALIGNLSNVLLEPLQQGSAAFRSMVAQNSLEALAFLALAAN